MKKMSSYESHTFWCIQCGNRGIDLQRKVNHRHSKHHRKKLWCPTCKMEVNHVECRNDAEIEEFKEKFAAGEYAEELEESLRFIEQENLPWS